MKFPNRKGPKNILLNYNINTPGVLYGKGHKHGQKQYMLGVTPTQLKKIEKNAEIPYRGIPEDSLKEEVLSQYYRSSAPHFRLDQGRSFNSYMKSRLPVQATGREMGLPMSDSMIDDNNARQKALQIIRKTRTTNKAKFIQRLFREKLERRKNYNRVLNELNNRNTSASNIQRVYRGHIGRLPKGTKKARNEIKQLEKLNRNHQKNINREKSKANPDQAKILYLEELQVRNQAKIVKLTPIAQYNKKRNNSSSTPLQTSQSRNNRTAPVYFKESSIAHNAPTPQQKRNTQRQLFGNDGGVEETKGDLMFEDLDDL